MGDRQVGREQAFKALFQYSFGRSAMDDIVARLMEEKGIRLEAKKFARGLAVGAHGSLADVDAAIKEHSKNWDPDRLGSADRAILRLAVYEMMKRDDIPPEVSINEAVELAKRYGGDDSPKFVNGILDEIRKAISHA